MTMSDDPARVQTLAQGLRRLAEQAAAAIMVV